MARWKQRGRFVALALAVLAGLASSGSVAATEECPTNTARFGGGVVRSWTSVAKDTTFAEDLGPWFTARYDWASHAFGLSASSMFADYSGRLDARERFRFVGPPPGTPVTFEIELEFHARPQPAIEDIGTWATGTVALSLGGQTLAAFTGTRSCSGYSCTSSGTLDTVVTVTATVTSGDPFTLDLVLSGSGGGTILWPGRIESDVALRYSAISPGAFLTTCHFDTIPSELLAVAGRPRPSLRILSVAPNPARGPVEVVFEAPPGDQVTLQMLDVTGRIVGSALYDGDRAGVRRLLFDRTRDLAPGTYFVRLARGVTADVRTVAIVR